MKTKLEKKRNISLLRLQLIRVTVSALTIAISLASSSCRGVNGGSFFVTSRSTALGSAPPPPPPPPPPPSSSDGNNTTSTSQQAVDSSSQQQLLSSSAKLVLPHCTLGNDTYELGERWNPNLPPFGVQVCVQCECIIRQRKSCYEAKVTCRRIINECPIIDSCPDGKKPVTTAGQCCKSCQSSSALAQPTPLPSSSSSPAPPIPNSYPPNPAASLSSTNSKVDTINSSNNETRTQQVFLTTELSQHVTSSSNTKEQPPPVVLDRLLLYKNERIKEFQMMTKNLPACIRRDLDRQPLVMVNNNQASKHSSGGKGMSINNNKNDLNGIDSRLAFKSLDGQSSYLSLSGNKGRANGASTSSTSASASSQSLPDGVNDQLHPNDVQSNLNYHDQQRQQTAGINHQQAASSTQKPRSSPPQPQPNSCILGNDIFQIGDRWNPILPPFGVQICVQCNCIARLFRRSCYEARITCRRINTECPSIDVCPNGKKPITVAGQCCKSCSKDDDDNNQETTTSSSSSTTATNNTTNSTTDDIIIIDLKNNHLRSVVEFQSIIRTYPACSKLREAESLIKLSNSNINNSTSSSSTQTSTVSTVKRSTIYNRLHRYRLNT